jgi:hypothetical protein
MTKDEALRLALEALKQIDEAMPFPVAKLAQKVIKEALAQPEHGWTPERIAGMARLKKAQDKKLAQLEPVAWNAGIPSLYPKMKEGETISVEYVELTPLHLTWVTLTEDEIVLISADCAATHQHTDIHFAKAIEAALKAKNT